MENERAITEHLFRRKYGELLGALLRSAGYEHFALIEEALQSAFEKALERWPYSGVPENASGWLYTVARNAFLESLRRKRTEGEKIQELVAEQEDVLPENGLDDLATMVLLCCNSAVPEKAQLCLTLKAACGFSIREIARAFGMNEEAVKKMVTRAREKADRSMVGELDQQRIAERFPIVLETMYALFTEGYSASVGDTQLRREVAEEAVRLADVLLSVSLTPEDRKGDLHALVALMLFQMARFPARTGPQGIPVRLQEQDRNLWDKEMIGAAMEALKRSQDAGYPGMYHIEARIAAVHSLSASFDATAWTTVVALYDQLLTIKDTPEVRLNRIVAVRYAFGPGRALNELGLLSNGKQGKVPMVQSFLFHSVRADLLAALGNIDDSRREWEEAMVNAPTEADYAFAEKKVKKVP